MRDRKPLVPAQAGTQTLDSRFRGNTLKRGLSSPSPLVGEGGEGGREATRNRQRMRDTSRPPPLTPPRKGEGNSIALLPTKP
jgi:hypothetical protein